MSRTAPGRVRDTVCDAPEFPCLPRGPPTFDPDLRAVCVAGACAVVVQD